MKRLVVILSLVLLCAGCAYGPPYNAGSFHYGFQTEYYSGYPSFYGYRGPPVYYYRYAPHYYGRYRGGYPVYRHKGRYQRGRNRHWDHERSARAHYWADGHNRGAISRARPYRGHHRSRDRHDD